MTGGGTLPVGPGILGFIAAFALALALWLLMRNMNARMRRMAYRDRDAQRAADARAADGPDGPDGPDGSGVSVDTEGADGSDEPHSGLSPDGSGPRA